MEHERGERTDLGSVLGVGRRPQLQTRVTVLIVQAALLWIGEYFVGILCRHGGSSESVSPSPDAWRRDRDHADDDSIHQSARTIASRPCSCRDALGAQAYASWP